MYTFQSLIRFPFDWRNPIGYVAAITVQYVALLYDFYFIGIVLAFVVGTFLFIRQSNNCTVEMLHVIIDLNKTKEKRSQFFGEFSKFIRLHSANKQLSWCSFIKVAPWNVRSKLFFYLFLSEWCLVYQIFFNFALCRLYWAYHSLSVYQCWWYKLNWFRWFSSLFFLYTLSQRSKNLFLILVKRWN